MKLIVNAGEVGPDGTIEKVIEALTPLTYQGFDIDLCFSMLGEAEFIEKKKQNEAA